MAKVMHSAAPKTEKKIGQAWGWCDRRAIISGMATNTSSTIAINVLSFQNSGSCCCPAFWAFTGVGVSARSDRNDNGVCVFLVVFFAVNAKVETIDSRAPGGSVMPAAVILKRMDRQFQRVLLRFVHRDFFILLMVFLARFSCHYHSVQFELCVLIVYNCGR